MYDEIKDIGFARANYSDLSQQLSPYELSGLLALMNVELCKLVSRRLFSDQMIAQPARRVPRVQQVWHTIKTILAAEHQY